MKKLIICEKPSVASNVKDALETREKITAKKINYSKGSNKDVIGRNASYNYSSFLYD